MNIFATNSDPILAAKTLCNKHVIKMCTESRQMLESAFPDHSKAYYSHPASIWARSSKENFEWLLTHAIAQCEEYTRRYKREHDTQKHIEWVVDNYKHLNFPKIELTPFARCFGPFKQMLDANQPDTLLAYQEFYRLDKISFAKWPTIDMIPDWWVEKSEKFVDKNFKDGTYIKR